MKILRALSGVVVLMAATSGVAFAAADQWSSYIEIQYLDNDDNGNKDSLVVRKVGLGNFNNPAGCNGSLSHATMKGGATAASKDLMNRVLTGAYLGGRKVRLFISGNACSQGTTAGSPIFFAVAMDSTQ